MQSNYSPVTMTGFCTLHKINTKRKELLRKDEYRLVKIIISIII